MSKRNYIIERASDVNGGQYIQTNPSYNSGYEDGKKAGKEYCASEIESLREQVEKLTKERDELHRAFNQPVPRSEWEKMQEQLAALAKQNEKMRKALTKWRYLDSSYNWRCGHCGNEVEDGHKEGCALSLPNLATPILNKIKAEAYREAAEICETAFAHGILQLGHRAAISQAIRAKADELEKDR